MFKKPILIIIIFLFIITSSIFSFGQQFIQTQKNRADSLKQDFTIFRNAFQNNYPSLYQYNTKEKIDALLDSCYISINQRTTELEFYKMLKLLLSTIKDGHLYCSPPPAFRTHQNDTTKFFPLHLYFIGQKAFVSDSSNISVPVGTEVLAINEVPINQIRTNLFQYLVADGAIQTKKYRILNNFFYFYYLIAYGEQKSFNVKIQSANGQVSSIKINAELEKDIVRNDEKTEATNFLNLTIRPKELAILTIKTFDNDKLKEKKEDFKSFLEASFKQLKDQKIKKLIIDLRGNGGGRDTYGALLYSYLTNKPFQYYKSLETATKDLPYEQFKSNVSSYNNLNAKMLEKIDKHRFQLKKEAHPNLQVIQPVQNNYTGKVWFLIDGLSFSTTAEFCAVAFSKKRGKFIGEETGGTYDGNTSGVELETTLPSTKINLLYGTVRYKMAVKPAKYKDRGIIPDYIIQPTINDIINKYDRQLSYALKLAAKK